jgi:hypothetical protein
MIEILLMAVGIYFFYYYKTKYEKKRAIKDYATTIAEYIDMYPQCKTSNGIKCNNCGSNHLKNQGVLGRDDSLRTVSCNHCYTKLYHIGKV